MSGLSSTAPKSILRFTRYVVYLSWAHLPDVANDHQV